VRQKAEPARPDPVRLGGVLDFMRLLWALNHELESLSKRMDATFGVTGPQRLVLRIAGQLPGITAGALSRVMHVHPSTLTGILKRLVDRGLVARSKDPNDARRALFSLTPRGRAIDNLRVGTVEAAVSRALRSFPPSGPAAARKILIAVADAIAKEGLRRAG
jgi:DNA-binding MarR family transcriptional regulator